MIAHCADHAWLQVVEGHVIRKTADVQFGIVMTARIAATDKHSVSTVASHVGQRQGLVVEQKVRDCPWHRLSKRDRSRWANHPMVWVGNKSEALPIAGVARRVITYNNHLSSLAGYILPPFRCASRFRHVRSKPLRCRTYAPVAPFSAVHLRQESPPDLPPGGVFSLL
jgi:hypothetical protein